MANAPELLLQHGQQFALRAAAQHFAYIGAAGMDLGGRGPGPIALSIVAEMQQLLSKRG